ncbi:diphthine synthase [Nanoarchaeota archaeon]
MLYLIGIGLNNEKDITVKGLEAVKKCQHIYLENYTSLLQCSKEDLEKFYNIKITKANRALVEQSEEILGRAKEQDVALLIIGDVFSATTHFQIYKEALEQGIQIEVIHNASVLTAVSQTGLQLYKFGRVASIPFNNKDIKVPFEILKDNQGLGLHTLFVLGLESEEDKYMTVQQALSYLQQSDLVNEKTMFIGCARLGSNDALIKAGTAEQLMKVDFGKPPHCVIIPGNMHFLEEEALELWG